MLLRDQEEGREGEEGVGYDARRANRLRDRFKKREREVSTRSEQFLLGAGKFLRDTGDIK